MTVRPAPTIPDDAPAADELERGWRYVHETLPDGREISRQVLLTPQDFLNPQEGDVMPQRPFHEQTTRDLIDMLEARYADDPNITVFHDLIMDWGVAGLPNPSPDISVVPNVQDKDVDEGRFYVQRQGTRPILAVEVVSPQYRKEDRVDKVSIYESAGIREYVILDRRKQRKGVVYEALGYRLSEGRYHAIVPDDDGFIFCEMVGLRIGFDEGQVVLEDPATGERLRTYIEAEAYAQAQTAARAEAERRAEAEAKARAQAERRLAELEAELKRLRGETPQS